MIDEPERRLNPRPWDHDFVLMRRTASALRKLVEAHLGSSSELTVLDFGCGKMPYRPLLKSRAREYVGADYPQNECAQVRIDEHGRLPMPDGCADVVISSQVLEHVTDVSGYLSECCRVLRPGGLLLLSTHGMWIYHPHPTDVRRWTGWGLRFEIEQAAFSVSEVVPCMGPLAYTTQLRLMLLKGLLFKLGAIGKWICRPICVLCQGMMLLEDRITPAWVTAENAAVYVIAARRKQPSSEDGTEVYGSSERGRSVHSGPNRLNSGNGHGGPEDGIRL